METGNPTPLSTPPERDYTRQVNGDWPALQTDPQIKRSASEELFPPSVIVGNSTYEGSKQPQVFGGGSETFAAPGAAVSATTIRSNSPHPLPSNEAVVRAISLSKKLSSSNIPTHITDSGNLMLDMTGYKSSEDEALRAEVIARKILAEELEGNYDIGALIGADEHGNLWIYNSEEAKEAAGRKFGLPDPGTKGIISDAASDPGYHSDEERLIINSDTVNEHRQISMNKPSTGLVTPPQTPPADIPSSGDPNRNYAKTLRLTSDQLKALCLKPGSNTMSFSVNRATCQANMWYWTYDVPIVISDIDGTITK